MSHSARDWERPGLSERKKRIARAAIEAFLADREPADTGDGSGLVVPDAAWCERNVRSFDLHIGACSTLLRFALGMLVVLLEWLPIVIVGRASRMSRLSLEERIRYLEALERHRVSWFALLFIGTKLPMLFAAFEEGAPLASTGFDRRTTQTRRRLVIAANRGQNP
ncbi:MAG: hypothetical protein EXR75_07515 [Myxococcales bacterium]|nr:hypothetical protein [Myxococcales bacterium]